MRVLITGIEGFVGSHLAEFLLTIPGLEIHGIVLNRSQTRNIDYVKSSLHLHEVNVCEMNTVQSLVADILPDRIVHLAGQAFVPTSLEDPSSTFQANISGGISILEAARKVVRNNPQGPAVLIVSTGEVYGKVPQDKQPITEGSPLNPNNPYAASKASIDLIAQQYKESFGVNVSVVRPFNHAGPRQSPVFVCSDFGKQFAEIAAGKRTPIMHVGDTEARRDFTDVRDVVRAYWLLFEQKSIHTVFNVCSGRSVQIGEVLTMFQEISGVRVEVQSEQQRLRAYDVRLVVGNCDRLKNATGWAPAIPFRQTLQDVYTYWCDQVNEQYKVSRPG